MTASLAHRLHLEDELEEVLGAKSSQQEVEEDDDSQCKVDEKCLVLLPGGAHFHRPGGTQVDCQAVQYSTVQYSTVQYSS